MKITLTIPILILMCTSCNQPNGQTIEKREKNFNYVLIKPDSLKKFPEEDTIEKYENKIENAFILVDSLPEFPGGNIALLQFALKNIGYSKSAKEQKIIIIRFTLEYIVEGNGSVERIYVYGKPIKDYSPVEIKTIENLKKNMPRWKPAKIGSKNVAYYSTLPLNVCLQITDN
jgi:hypothetical protein